MQVQFNMDGTATLIYQLKPTAPLPKLTPVQQAVALIKAKCAGDGIAIPPCNFVRGKEWDKWDKRNRKCVLKRTRTEKPQPASV